MLRRMDLRATAEQESLRDAFRAWLDGAPALALRRRAAAPLRRPGRDGRVRAALAGRPGRRRLGRASPGPRSTAAAASARSRTTWSSRSWPGPGRPSWSGRIGINLVGPTLLAHGTPEQKERFLPRILSADELWCQLFSEPDAGSDLASLTTRAVPVDGGYRVTGRKVWTSYAQFADWGLCLTRSDPDAPKRQQGITALIVDMHAEGVEVHPLVQSTGEAEFNEVELDDVFVPTEQRVGNEGEGWTVAGSTLAHERGINPRQLVIHTQLIEELLRLAQANGSFDDWRLRQQLAQAATEVRLFQLHNWRSLTRLSKGEAPGPEGSALKLYWSEMSKRLHQTALDVLGAGLAAVGGGAGEPGRRRLAALVALLPGVVHLRRHQRDPADAGGRARPGAAPGLSVPETAARHGRMGGTGGWVTWQRNSRRSATRSTGPWPPSP